MKYFLGISYIGSIAGSVFLAAEESFPAWAQYGILGAVVVALVYTKALVPGWIYQDLKTTNTELKTELKDAKIENRDLTQQIIDNQGVILPALQTATDAIQQAMPVVNLALNQMDRRREGGS